MRRRTLSEWALACVDVMAVDDLGLRQGHAIIVGRSGETERKALAAYQAALEIGGDDTALRNMLEDQIEAEQHHVEELELILDQVQTPALDRAVGS